MNPVIKDLLETLGALGRDQAVLAARQTAISNAVDVIYKELVAVLAEPIPDAPSSLHELSQRLPALHAMLYLEGWIYKNIPTSELFAEARRRGILDESNR